MTVRPRQYECFAHPLFLGVTVPKCACSSIRCWFRSLSGGGSYDRQNQTSGSVHEWYRENVTKLTDSGFQEKESFIVVRDPLERAVSIYDDKISDAGAPYFYRPGLTVGQWLDELLASDDPESWDEHWRPQIFSVPPSIGRIISLENLSSGLNEFIRSIGLEPVRWRNDKAGRNKKTVLTKDQEGKARAIWPEDFNLVRCGSE